MFDSLVVEEPFVPVDTVLVLFEFEFEFALNLGKLCGGADTLLPAAPSAPGPGIEVLFAADPVPGPGRIVVPPLARDALLRPRGFVVGKLEELVEIRDDDSEGGLCAMTRPSPCKRNQC